MAVSPPPPNPLDSADPRSGVVTDEPPQPRAPGEMRSAASPVRWWDVRALLLRLHFYGGVLVGPFLLVAATTGLVYTVTPQVESALYRHELTVTPRGSADPLAAQVAVAKRAVPQGKLESVTTGPGPADSTRVIFEVDGLPDGYVRTVFVDPYGHRVLGALTTYGQWLPVRAWLDSLHRTLHLGEFGRNYSELAASWLWVEVLGGLALWIGAPGTRRRLRRVFVPRRGPAGRRRVMSWHAVVGLSVSVGLLGLSATGLTWSAHAGANIDVIRAAIGGGTPAVSTDLPDTSGRTGDVGIDAVTRSARAAGLSGVLEITPPAKPGEVYTVAENTRSWPERQDSVAVDPATGKVTEKLRFADYPLLAKLSRWGVDAHMGLLFGLANQIVLALLAIGLITMLLLGYRMWWLRRPTRSDARAPARGTWRRLPGRILAPAVVVAAVIGYFLPLFGLPLLAFLLVDVAVAAVRRRRTEVAR